MTATIAHLTKLSADYEYLQNQLSKVEDLDSPVARRIMSKIEAIELEIESVEEEDL